MITDCGTVEYKGKILYLQQQAYIDSVFNDPDADSAYFAHAIDDDGEDYMVRWEILDAYCEEEADSCNWNHYTVNLI